MLRQDIKPAGMIIRIIENPLVDIRERRHAFKHFKAIGGNQNGFRGAIKPMPRTPNPLQQTRRAFGRANLNHQIDIPPIDAKIKR